MQGGILRHRPVRDMDMDADLPFLKRAIALSRHNVDATAGGPFGAVVVLDGRIIGEGWNRVLETADPTAHAEVVAIRTACAARGTHVLAGTVLYASCEPCPMCLAAAYWARVARLVWAANRDDAAAIGFDDAHLYRELVLPGPARSLPSRQLLRREAKAVMAAWAGRQDKVLY